MQTTVDLLEAALSYANNGWYIAPVKCGEKSPFIKWKDGSSIDEEQIRSWWAKDYNIAIITGEKSGIVVMDIDPRSGGHESLFEKCSEYGNLPDTLTFKTGGGGTHYVFKHPGFKVKTVPNIFPGIDSKGDGGLIIAPPSLHASGEFYEIVNMGTPIADMPKWWAEKVKVKESVKGVKKVITTEFPEGKYLDGKQFKQGERDTALFAIACSMRNYDLDEDEIYTRLSEVNEKRCVPAMEDQDIKRISKSASKYPSGITHADFGGEELESPAPGLTLPFGYKVDHDGISYTNVKNETKKIFPIPVALTRRLKNVDTGNEKIELQFYRNGRWFPLIIPRSVLFNTSKVIDLADKSLPVSSTNVKDLVRYLSDFEASNLDMQLDESVSRLGWVGKDRFTPGVDDGLQLDASDSFTKGYVCSGEVAEWASNVAPVLEFPVARFLLAASFASPLLKILKVRSFVVYVYGPSGGGKSTAVKVGLSVWGNPTDTIVTFGDTVVSIERRAAFLCNIPLGLDERQSASDQTKVEQLIYMLANGKSKGKGTRDGAGIQDQVTWDMVTLATGEDSLTTSNTKGGVVTRTIELFSKPIPDDTLAVSLHDKLDEAYGVVGPDFVRHILGKNDELKELYTSVKDDLRSIHGDNIGTHLSAVSSVAVADYYMNKLFFKKDELGDSLHLASTILKQLITRDDMDDAQRAYDDFQSWFATNQNFFTDFSREEYGWVNKTPPDNIYIYPTIFKKTMTELGFSEKRIKQEWAQRGWIKTEKRGNEEKTRFSVREWHEKKKAMITVIVVRVDSSGQ